MLMLLRSALFNLLFYVLTALTVVASMPVLALPRRAFIPVARGYAAVMLTLLRLTCGITVRVTGTEHLPRGGAALIAAKHQSAFDTLIWLHLLPDCCYVLKRELLFIPLWGWLAQKSRMIAVDRKGAGKTMRRMLLDGKAAAREGRQIVIFPEGTRVAPGLRIPYHPGILGLAGALKLPVVPVATNSGLFWPRRAFAKRPGEVVVAVQPPLPAGLPRQELMQRLQAAIEDESDRLFQRDKSVDKAVD